MNMHPRLTPTVIPRSLVRATVLGDVIANFGLPPDVAELAQRGFLAGDIDGISIHGIDSHGYVRDTARLSFDDLTRDDDIEVDTRGGRSMIEALSVRLAHTVSYSIATMRRKGLTLAWVYHLRPGRQDAQVMARYGLRPSAPLTYAPGAAPREVVAVRPGSDRGIRYSHATVFAQR